MVGYPPVCGHDLEVAFMSNVGNGSGESRCQSPPGNYYLTNSLRAEMQDYLLKPSSIRQYIQFPRQSAHCPTFAQASANTDSVCPTQPMSWSCTGTIFGPFLSMRPETTYMRQLSFSPRHSYRASMLTTDSWPESRWGLSVV